MLTNEIIKCPNCGSSAQVKILDVIEYSDGTIVIKRSCGCGHHWVVTAKKVNKNKKNT